MRIRATLLPALAGLVLALGACADRLPVNAEGDRTALPPGPTFTTPVAAAPAPPAPPAAAAPATPAASPVKPAADTCGAADLAYLVGKARSEIPVPVDVTKRRVVCQGCPVTQDLRPDRQTITYDLGTGKVTQVQCG